MTAEKIKHRELSGPERRKKLIQLLREQTAPLSGTALGRATGVSRQVVVQDVALLRREGYQILSTNLGYHLAEPSGVTRLVKVCHTNEETEEELNTIVDLGGCVEDVLVNHRAYGTVSARLGISSRRDVQMFVERFRTGKSKPLMNITSGYHFHHISADREEILDEIEAQLSSKGFLAEVLPYEQELYRQLQEAGRSAPADGSEREIS